MTVPNLLSYLRQWIPIYNPSAKNRYLAQIEASLKNVIETTDGWKTFVILSRSSFLHKYTRIYLHGLFFGNEKIIFHRITITILKRNFKTPTWNVPCCLTSVQNIDAPLAYQRSWEYMEFTLKLNRLFSDLIRALLSPLITAGLARFAQPSFLSIRFTGDPSPIFSDIVNTEDESLPVNSFGEQAGSIVKLRGSRIVCGSLDTCKRCCCSLSLFFLRTVSFSLSPTWRCSPSINAATLLLQCLQSFFLRLLFGRLESVWRAVDRARDERASSTKVFHATSVSSRHPLFLFRFVTRTEELVAVDGSRSALRRNGSVELRSKTPAISSRLSNDLVDVPRPLSDTRDRWARFSFESRDGVSSVPGKISSYTWVSAFEISRDCCSSSKPWFSIYEKREEHTVRNEWFMIFRSIRFILIIVNILDDRRLVN